MNTHVQIRNLSPKAIKTLKRRAAEENQSLSSHLRGELERFAERSTMKELYERIRSRPPIEIGDDEIAVPGRFLPEYLNAVRGLEPGGKIEAGAAADLSKAFMLLPVMQFDVTEFAGEIRTLRHNITPYDAGHVCLARALAFPLVTADRRRSSSRNIPLP